MLEDYLQEHLDDLIRDINSNSTINESGLKNTMFPDDLILSIHNSLGNVKQLLNSEQSAFNSVQQLEVNKSAVSELEGLSSSLFSAWQTGLLSEATYNNLATKTRRLTEEVTNLIDPEYF